MLIRDATEADLPAILAIYNDVIRTTTAVYTEEPLTLEDRRTWFRGRVASGYPVLVATEEASPETVIALASFGDFRAWPDGYRHTVEHSVHVAAPSRGQGIGTALVTALLPRAAVLGKHMMIGAIDAGNEGSIRMHERLGFVRAGTLREVGTKFGRWLDVVFMQRALP
ncbi:MAG TPA: GNAT family N-acetyltransferase [Acetobacteraceae bacterium]|nr:GNAT family N-acetyltransferase [Acetobacteraceae bacterium]